MSDQSGAKPRSLLSWSLWGAALFGVAAVLYIIAQASFKPADEPAPQKASAPAAAGAKSLAEKLTRPAEPTPAPDYVVYNEAGAPLRLSDFKGKVVVMNIWATWCAPCKIEMPTLAKLQSAYAGKEIEVVTVSIDTVEDAAKARLFIAQNDPLKFYHDRESKLPWALKPVATGAPTTIIYGRDGLEKARIAGEADWAGSEARALVDEALAG